MGPEICLLILMSSWQSFCVASYSPNWLSLFTSLFSKSSTHAATSLHTLLSVDDLASPYTARTEATHTKCSPPGHHNRVHVFPWTSLPFLPLYHWDEGALFLPMAVSPHAVFITALLLLQFGLFPASWVSPSLLDLHHCINSPGNLPS